MGGAVGRARRIARRIDTLPARRRRGEDDMQRRLSTVVGRHALQGRGNLSNDAATRCQGGRCPRDPSALAHRMHLGSTLIVDTFAEAFRMRYARLIVTAHDDYWLDAALREFCGYGSSVIACDAEIGVERCLAARGNARRPARRRRAGLRLLGRRTGEGDPQPHRPVPDDLPDDRRLQRPARRRRPGSRSASTSASSATAFRRASSSTAAATGGSR